MKQNIYSIYDTAAAAYMRPFFCGSDNEAKRMFSDIATDADHVIGKHAEDYSLCRLGIFDDGNGDLNNEAVEVIITGLEAVAAARKIAPGSLHELDIGEAQGTA